MRIFAVVIAILLGLGGCGQPKQFYIDHGYVRLAAVPGRPAAAYFTLHGGPADATLISVHTEVAIKAELHQSMMTGTMSAMKPLDHVALPAGGTIAFKPGGLHVMLFDMNPAIKPGKTITLDFTFADGSRYEYDAMVIAAGAAAPKF
ncbi:copper chaperone PCu(A)C [soil metagenome]